MKVQVLQEDLSKILTTSIHFVNTRSTLPILSNFLLIAEKTKLKLQATNLEMSISVSVGAKVDEVGKLTVPAKLFFDLISNVASGPLEFSEDKETLKIVGNNFKGSIGTSPANDFPTVPDEIDSKKSFTLPASELISALSNIIFTASSDESRPVLTGILFVFDAPKATNSSTLSLVASDGFRLSRINLPLSSPVEIKNLIIPKKSLIELIKIAEKADQILFEYKENDNQLIIQVGDTCLTTRLIEGNFPDFEKIIPTSSTTTIELDKNDLNRGVKLAAVFASIETNVVKMNVLENKIDIVSESPKGGNQITSIDAKVTGGNLDISFNYKFISEFLGAVSGEGIEIKLTDSASPAIFSDPKNSQFLHLIMPVMVKN